MAKPYRLVRRRLRLEDPLWVWVGGRLTHPKGDPTAFGWGELLKILKPGACLYYYFREEKRGRKPKS